MGWFLSGLVLGSEDAVDASSVVHRKGLDTRPVVAFIALVSLVFGINLHLERNSRDALRDGVLHRFRVGAAAREIGGLDVLAGEELPIVITHSNVVVDLDAILPWTHVRAGVAILGLDLHLQIDDLTRDEVLGAGDDLLASRRVHDVEVNLEVELVGAAANTTDFTTRSIRYLLASEETRATVDGWISQTIGSILVDVEEVIRKTRIGMVALVEGASAVLERREVVFRDRHPCHAFAVSILPSSFNVGDMPYRITIAVFFPQRHISDKDSIVAGYVPDKVVPGSSDTDLSLGGSSSIQPLPGITPCAEPVVLIGEAWTAVPPLFIQLMGNVRGTLTFVEV